MKFKYKPSTSPKGITWNDLRPKNNNKWFLRSQREAKSFMMQPFFAVHFLVVLMNNISMNRTYSHDNE